MTAAAPIDALLPDILAALAAQPRLVLQAPPGAGKTTRVPLALLAAPWRGDGRILMLEPRRIAARAAAEFMAAQLGEAVGARVGYRIRFEARVSAATRIEVVTEGILTRLIQDDPELRGIAAILFDEFHERHLHGDLGAALALDVQANLRPDLRLVIMSATLDGARIARWFDAPQLASAGRSFPVQVTHPPARTGEVFPRGREGQTCILKHGLIHQHRTIFDIKFLRQAVNLVITLIATQRSVIKLAGVERSSQIVRHGGEIIRIATDPCTKEFQNVGFIPGRQRGLQRLQVEVIFKSFDLNGNFGVLGSVGINQGLGGLVKWAFLVLPQAQGD